MRYWLRIYKMQDNLLLVEHKKGRCNCQDGPIFREFFFFLGGGEEGEGRRESIIHKFGFEE